MKKTLAMLAAIMGGMSQGSELPYMQEEKYRKKKVPLYCECGGRVKYTDKKSKCMECGKEW